MYCVLEQNNIIELNTGVWFPSAKIISVSVETDMSHVKAKSLVRGSIVERPEIGQRQVGRPIGAQAEQCLAFFV